ncbi:Protein priB, partial [Leucoagaricus sp. SymC.cos]
SKRPGACKHCKKLKMKCDFPRNDNTCKRCKAGGHACIVEGRKPRTAPKNFFFFRLVDLSALGCATFQFIPACCGSSTGIVVFVLYSERLKDDKFCFYPHLKAPFTVRDASAASIILIIVPFVLYFELLIYVIFPLFVIVSAFSKREYLLAQIRQKDAIIESLLKQLHNPYLATPLSIASYRMATSPSDQNNRNVLAWLDRLQSSVPEASNAGTPNIFTELRNKEEAESDGESETPNIGLVAPEDEEQEGDANSSEAEKIQSSLPDAHVPLGLIAKLSIDNNNVKGKKERAHDVGITDEDLNDDNVVANETYFMPGPAFDLNRRALLIEQHSPPEILVHGLVNPDDVQNLFDIFYKYVNPFISLLDPVLHTPASTFARCPFLFTVVCAISSRYYVEKSEIYPIAMHFAKHSAANALIDGWKSVELCQAYILMSIYAVPARRWEEDRSWLYTGLAIRIATDLNLHHMSNTRPKNEKEEREALNRARVWMICFNLDRSTATQFGKPSTIKEDYIVRNAREWYMKSQYNLPHDVHLCAYSALLQIVAKFHDEIFSDPSAPSGLNKNVDFRKITMKHDESLTQYHNEWLKRFEESSNPNDPSCVLRCSLLPFLVGYSRLVMFSFGFQHAFQRGIERSDQVFFTKCLEAAKSVIKNMIDGLAPSGYMRYSPDGHFVFASFASAFLLKLLRPEFASLLSQEQESGIFELIGRLIQTLSSLKIAIDDRHTPKLYARFLAGLLSRHRRDGATVGRLHPNPPNQQPNQNEIPPNSMNTFSVAPQPQPAMQSAQDLDYNPNGGQPQAQNLQTPIYRPEATYNAGTGPIHFGSDMELAVLDGSYSPDEEMLATMQAIKNPSWWQNMMMPGFSWTPDPSPSPPHGMGHQSQPQSQPQPAYHPALHQHQGVAMPHALHPSFNAFQTVQVPML